MPVVSVKDLTTDLLIRYGFQILGALVILGVGLLLARWVGNLMGQWLERRHLEPPVRSLMVKAVRIVVLMFTLVVALDKFGFQVAPLVAGIGVAGLGIGIALQGVLSNVVAGLSIIMTKPFRVGEWISIVGVYGQVSTIELFSTTLVHPDQSRVVIPNRKIVGEILHNHGTTRQLDLKVGVAYGTDLSKAQAARARDPAREPARAQESRADRRHRESRGLGHRHRARPLGGGPRLRAGAGRALPGGGGAIPGCRDRDAGPPARGAAARGRVRSAGSRLAPGRSGPGAAIPRLTGAARSPAGAAGAPRS